MAENIEFDCLSKNIKLHLEGALIHYIKDIQNNIYTFAVAAVEFKERNPTLSEHYLALVKSQEDFIEELQKAKGVIQSFPECKRG